MGSIFNPPKPKASPPPAPPPTADDPAIEDARRKEREAARRRAGIQSTRLTDPLGDTATSTAPVRTTKLGSGSPA